LIDHHCHSVVGRRLDAGGFGALLTEAPAHAPGADPFDSMLGLAVRRECAPVLDLPRHAPAADYLTRRAELGPDEVTARLLAASGPAALLVDHGFSGGELIGRDDLGRLAAAPVSEVIRLEAVAEELAAAGVGPRDYPDALVAEVARRRDRAVGF